MKLSENLHVISETFKERRGLRRLVGNIVKQNSKDQQSEKLLNSAISELMNVFSAVENKSQSSGHEINGMVIRPKKLTNTTLKGTEKDPRVIIRMAQEDPEFSKTFSIKTTTDEKGQEEYIIKRRNISELFS